MKKNGRLVAIALGSVLCASCVGGAFLVAGTTPAAETVRAADEVKTYSWSIDDSQEYKNFFGSSKKTETFNGIDWTWTYLGSGNPKVNNFPTKNYSGIQIGTTSSPFGGASLTAPFGGGSYDGYSVKTLKIKTLSKGGSVTMGVASGSTPVASNVKTATWNILSLIHI